MANPTTGPMSHPAIDPAMLLPLASSVIPPDPQRFSAMQTGSQAPNAIVVDNDLGLRKEGRHGSRNKAALRSGTLFVCCFASVLSVLTSLPYWIGQTTHIPGEVFTGLIEHSLDSNNYLAYEQQAASGQWVFRNPMTPEPHRAVFFNLEWLLIGKMSSVLRVSLTVATDITRIIFVFVMCFGVYWLSADVLRSEVMRRIALVATMAGGGFGWIVTVHLLGIKIDSSYFLDLTNANLFPFYWVLRLPHFLISETFVVLGLGFFLSGERRHKILYYLGAGLCYLAAGSCRPYDMLFLMAATSVYLAYSFLRSRENRRDIVWRSAPVLMCLPLLAYYYWIFKIHPIFRWWSLPGNPAPPAWDLAWSFGPSLFLFLFAAWRLRRKDLGVGGWFLLGCLLTAIVLTHLHAQLHFAFQFATNILIPMVLLGLLGIEDWIMDWRARRGVWADAGIVAVLFVNSLTSLALTGQAVVLARRGEYHTDAQTIEAYSWLEQHSQRGDVVLADLELSNEIPRYTGDIVYCGYYNAVQFAQKNQSLKKFFQPGATDQFRQQIIENNAVRFVLLTAEEQRTTPEIASSPFLVKAFQNRSIAIFAVASRTSP